jgi:hypothetical protein
LIEIDNWGGYSLHPKEWDSLEKRAAFGRWGWDDIGWFAHQSQKDRDHFLWYAHRWLRIQDPSAYFQMPARRPLAEAQIVKPNGVVISDYQANNPSPACPHGMAQEDTIRQIWADPEPGWMAAWHAKKNHTTSSLTSSQQNVPQPVLLVGDIQRILGGSPGDSWSPYSQMKHLGRGQFELALLVPWAGKYHFSICAGGTMTEYYNQGGIAGGPPFCLETFQDNQRVRIRFDYRTKYTEALDDKDHSMLG